MATSTILENVRLKIKMNMITIPSRDSGTVLKSP